MTDWAIPQQAKLKYTQLFNLHDRSRSGFLSGLQCRDILMQSGLPRTILAEIWNLSDIDGDGQLTREEFILAMHLTNQARAGQALPQELSPDLVPPSYRRARSISTTSVHSTTSSVGSSDPTPSSAATATVISSNSNTLDDQLSQKSSETMMANAGLAGSILSSNSFEDKRRENFEKGRAELERRRLKIIEQQTSIISEQLVKCKKQVADAKSKIDSMRSERDTKAGLITSLEAQLKTVRERKAFLDHEEMQIIAIARDLNLVKSAHSAELDQQATIAKQASINQLKEKLADVENQRDVAVERLSQAKVQLEESMKELKSVSEEVNKTYDTYKEKIADAKVLRQQFIEENKSKPIDLDSIWDSNPTQTATNDTLYKADPVSTLTSSDDPWSTTSAFPDPKQPFDDPFAFASSKSTIQTATASNNNNDTGFEPPRDYNNSFSSISPEQKEQSTSKASNNFNESTTSVLKQKKKLYKVLYEFEARNPDELTINPGDIIIGSEIACEPGWLSGETNGRSGLFPEAYVEPIANDEKPTTESVIEHGLSATADLSNIQPTPGISSQEAQPKASPSKSTIVKYKVIYAFEARNPDELTINPGDIITGLDLPHEPGWLMGELNSQRGLFPEAYVERLAEAKINPDGQIGTLRRGSSSGSLRSKKSRAKKAEVATVIANYRALGQEQLNLEKGQLVLIRRKMDSGWWEGELQIKGGQDGNELDHLIGELIDSELDYVNDLQLCQNAYIKPLSASFDLSHIFTNWHQLIERHESTLRCVYVESCRNEDPNEIGRVGYGFVLETFQSLLKSIVDLYVDFCSRQLDVTRQLEAKIASDIRFRQLVNESQRKLRRLIENGQSSSVPTDGHNGQPVDQNVERAQRNSNLPLTSFLIKPMQRITKYELLFDRMLKSFVKERHKVNPLMQTQLDELKRSAQLLCRQVNEACRMKEDDQDNSRRLKWCQNHILQHPIEHPQVRPYPLGCSSPLAGVSEMRLSGEFMRSQSSSDSLISIHSSIPLEQIQFESNTNCLGPRRILRAGSMSKLSSSRELIVFLFNDLLLITLVKGGVSLQVPDVFKSDRARQAYYKLYRRPILLEDLELADYASNQFDHQTPLLSHSIGAPPIKDQSDLVVSLLDRKSGSIYNLVASSQAQRNQWIEMLIESVNEARRARESHESHSLVQAAKLLNINDCFGRLFVTVLELVKITTPKSNLADEKSQTSLSNRLSSSEQPELVQNLSIRLQLRLYKKATSILDQNEQREIIAISDEFRTKTLVVCHATRQPTMVDMCHEMSMSILDSQRDVYKFSETDSTQFLLASAASSADGMEYLDVELVDDSLYKETLQLGRKRISLDQLLGRDKSCGSGRSSGPFDGKHLDRDGSSASCRRALSIRSDRGVQPLQADRPVEMTLKLKTLSADITSHRDLNGHTTRTATARLISNGSAGGRKYGSTVTKYNVKLRLHLQLFNCDTTNSLI